MKIELNTSERILTIGILNQFKGDLNKLAEIILDLKGLNLKPEEIEELGIKNDGQSITWSAEKDVPKEFELSEMASEWIKKFIQEKNDKGEFGVADIAIIELSKKLA